MGEEIRRLEFEIQRIKEHYQKKIEEIKNNSAID